MVQLKTKIQQTIQTIDQEIWKNVFENTKTRLNFVVQLHGSHTANLPKWLRKIDVCVPHEFLSGLYQSFEIWTAQLKKILEIWDYQFYEDKMLDSFIEESLEEKNYCYCLSVYRRPKTLFNVYKVLRDIEKSFLNTFEGKIMSLLAINLAFGKTQASSHWNLTKHHKLKRQRYYYIEERCNNVSDSQQENFPAKLNAKSSWMWPMSLNRDES